jgi:hypothetical protein
MPLAPTSLPVPVSLSLTLPGDRLFRAIGADIAAMLARQLGYSAADAWQIGKTFTEEASAVADAQNAGDTLDISYVASETQLEIRVRCGGRSFDIVRPRL